MVRPYATDAHVKHAHVAVLGLVLSCAPHHRHRHFVEPTIVHDYGRELGELRHAIDDLEHNAGTPGNVDAPREQLEQAFASICHAERISCDRKAWGNPWRTRGATGDDLAHALGDIDRAYSRFAHAHDPSVDEATRDLELARHELRESLVVRERLALGPRLPATRVYLFAAKDMKYVRSLIAQPPPAEHPWDYRRTVADLDEAIRAVEHVDPDLARVPATYQPDPADFAWLPYRDRIAVAADVLGATRKELRDDRDPDVRRGPIADESFVKHLDDAVTQLENVPWGQPAPAKGPALDPYAPQIMELRIALRSVQRDQEAPIRTELAEAEIEDAFKTACKVEHLDPDPTRWSTDDVDGSKAGAMLLLDAVAAVFERVPDDRFAESRRHIEIARRALRDALMLHEKLGPDEVPRDALPYVVLLRELAYARAIFDVAPPSDLPWDARAAVARVDAATELLEAAHVEPKRSYYHPKPVIPSAAYFTDVPYRDRLRIARDILHRAVADVEHVTRATKDRARVIPQVHELVDAVDAALAKPIVATRAR
jgi:hypothetical protein